MALIGALVGLLYGAFSGSMLVAIVFPGAAVPGFLTPFLSLAGPVAGLLSALPVWLAAIVWYLLNILVFWLLSIPAQSSTGLTSTTSTPPAANPIPPTGTQNFFRGFGHGTATIVNFAILSPFLAIPPVLILAILSFLPILSLVTAIRRNAFFQGVISWMSWLLPVHWLGNLIGFLIFLIFRAITLFTGTAAGIRLDLTSGIIESRAPAPVTAFNVAVFTYVGPAFAPGPFLGANVSSHEVGHAINSAAMTPFYTWGTVIEEFRLFGAPHRFSIGQQTAESRGAPRPGALYSAMWSP